EFGTKKPSKINILCSKLSGRGCAGENFNNFVGQSGTTHFFCHLSIMESTLLAASIDCSCVATRGSGATRDIINLGTIGSLFVFSYGCASQDKRIDEATKIKQPINLNSFFIQLYPP